MFRAPTRHVLAAATTAVASLAVGLAPSAADAGSLGTAQVIATPTYSTPVAFGDGVLAWATGSGRGNRFGIVLRRAGVVSRLAATSAVGWIDGVKLGTDSGGHAIVVYSRCPQARYGSNRVGHASTDGCRLWWARLSGGPARRVAAAPADTSVGTATLGKVYFAVQPNTAHNGPTGQAALVETASLTGTRVHALRVPTPDGAVITDLSTNGADVAFTELPFPADEHAGASQVWLDVPSAAPRLLAQQISDQTPIDYDAVFFDGVTLTGDAAYAFLFADPNLESPVASAFERIPLAGGPIATAPWTSPWPSPPSPAGDGISASAFDPGSGELALDLFGPDQQDDPSTCTGGPADPNACPILVTGPVSFP
jgi:hypothetical protein